nr:PEP-CTERM sorting domain-containing protein [Rhodoferax sp. U11-2br]
MVSRDISFNDWAETTQPALISSAAQPTYALLPTQFVAIGSSPVDGQSLGISDPTVVIDPTIPSPVPEPETWAMLLAGLLVMVFVSRRRVPR